MQSNYILDQQTRKQLNILAREELKHKMLSDILMDIQICKIEEWNYTDYIKDIIRLLEEVLMDSDDKLKSTKNISDFLNEIENICKKYNLSISHEDSHGGFIIEDYDESNIEWLKDASDHTSKEE